MTDASIKDLTPLSLEIFHELVTAYLEDGLPVGSSRLAKSGKFDFLYMLLIFWFLMSDLLRWVLMPFFEKFYCFQ